MTILMTTLILGTAEPGLFNTFIEKRDDLKNSQLSAFISQTSAKFLLFSIFESLTRIHKKNNISPLREWLNSQRWISGYDFFQHVNFSLKFCDFCSAEKRIQSVL